MYTGGYYSIRSSLIKADGLHRHTGRTQRPVPDSVLAAVNAAQSVRWTINPFVSDVMRTCWDRKDPVPGLPSPEDAPLPQRFDDEVWDQMSVQDRARHKAEVALVHSSNAALRGQREEIARRLRLADDLSGNDFYYPHALDFRSRMYPLPQDLHPQGDDTQKGLLMFSGKGQPLSESGMRWLRIGLANAFGNDKAPLDERVEWTRENWFAIQSAASDPHSPKGDLWKQAENPWTFLALAHSYVNGGLDGVPIHMDATCSGVQHLSALGLDPVGGRATNLMDTGAREDLYTEVAEAVMKNVSALALRGDRVAQAWVGNITRKTVKRAVMTTPYGVTSRGIRDQLLADKLCSGLSVKAVEAADFMRDQIVQALEVTVVSAREIMRWLQQVAHALASSGIPFSWTTPSGVRVHQAYYKAESKKIETIYGKVFLNEEREVDGLDTSKSSSSAAPNFIHSFDAAHLHRTVLAMVGAGISDFTVIHDSFGARPNDVERMGQLLREEFVNIYREDWLTRTYEDVRAYAPGVEIPEPPVRGELDVDGVLSSPYFFS